MSVQPAGYCPKCEYMIDPGVCPECGFDCPPKKLRKRPRYWFERRRIARAVLILTVGVGVWCWYDRPPVTSYLSSWFLLWSQDPADPKSGDAAEELARRFANRGLSKTQKRIFAERIWNKELQQSSIDHPIWKHVILNRIHDRLYGASTNEKDQIELRHQIANRHGVILTRTFSRGGWPFVNVPTQLFFDSSVVKVEIDGVDVQCFEFEQFLEAEANDDFYLIDKMSSIHPFGGETIREQCVFIRGCSPGMHQLTIETKNTVGDPRRRRILTEWRSTTRIEVVAEQIPFDWLKKVPWY